MGAPLPQPFGPPTVPPRDLRGPCRPWASLRVARSRPRARHTLRSRTTDRCGAWRAGTAPARPGLRGCCCRSTLEASQRGTPYRPPFRGRCCGTAPPRTPGKVPGRIVRPLCSTFYRLGTRYTLQSGRQARTRPARRRGEKMAPRARAPRGRPARIASSIAAGVKMPPTAGSGSRPDPSGTSARSRTPRGDPQGLP